MTVAVRAGPERRAGAAAVRPWFSLFLAYLLLLQSVLCLALSTQHALAARPDFGTLFCHVSGDAGDDAGSPAALGAAVTDLTRVAGPLAQPGSAPGTPGHDAGPLMAPCAICAFAAADYTPPAEWGVVPLSRTFVRLHRPTVKAPQVLALARVTPRLSQGPPNPV